MASMGRGPKRKSAYVRQQPKNNTPVHTEVLWGGGLWWGLRAGAPHADHEHHVIDVYRAIIGQIRHARLQRDRQRNWFE
jgi:hypothetical protein